MELRNSGGEGNSQDDGNESLVKSYIVGLEKSQSKLEQEDSQLHVGCYQGRKRKRKES